MDMWSLVSSNEFGKVTPTIDLSAIENKPFQQEERLIVGHVGIRSSRRRLEPWEYIKPVDSSTNISNRCNNLISANCIEENVQILYHLKFSSL